MEHTEQFRDRRLSARVSQGELAKESGVNRQRLSYAECGYISLSEQELSAVEDALRRIVERRMATFRGLLEAV